MCLRIRRYFRLANLPSFLLGLAVFYTIIKDSIPKNSKLINFKPRAIYHQINHGLHEYARGINNESLAQVKAERQAVHAQNVAEHKLIHDSKLQQHEQIKAENQARWQTLHEENKALHEAHHEEVRNQRLQELQEGINNGTISKLTEAERAAKKAEMMAHHEEIKAQHQAEWAHNHEVQKAEHLAHHEEIRAQNQINRDSNDNSESGGLSDAEREAKRQAMLQHHEEMRAERLSNVHQKPSQMNAYEKWKLKHPGDNNVPLDILVFKDQGKDASDDLNPNRYYENPDSYLPPPQQIPDHQNLDPRVPFSASNNIPGAPHIAQIHEVSLAEMNHDTNSYNPNTILAKSDDPTNQVFAQVDDRVLTQYNAAKLAQGKVDWLNDKSKNFQDQRKQGWGNDTFDPKELDEVARKEYFDKTSRIIDRRADIEHNERFASMKTQPSYKHLPQMVIVGSKKCGTGALARALMMHPLVAYAGEQFYFNRFWRNNLTWYQDQMPLAHDAQLTYEKTPNYVYSFSIAEKINNLGPNMKVINLVCDPIKRIYSDFLHIFRFDRASATMEKFEQMIDSGIADIRTRQLKVDQGLTTWQEMWLKEDFQFSIKGHAFEKVILKSYFSLYLKKWTELYGSNILNLDGSKLYTESGDILVKVQQFLGLPVFLDNDNFFWNGDRGMSCKIDIEGNPICPGHGKGRSLKTEVPESIKQKLRNVVDPWTRELEAWEGKNYDHWNW